MADLIKLVKVAEEIAEELVEHSPAAKQAVCKLLAESGILGRVAKSATREFEHFAGKIKLLQTDDDQLLRIFEKEVSFQTAFVRGTDAKVLSLAKNHQTIWNEGGITQLVNLKAEGNLVGVDVLKRFPAPESLIKKYPHLAERGVPNWVHGSDDWIFYQANKHAPTNVTVDNLGRLHAIEYRNPDFHGMMHEVPVHAGPFKGLAGSRFEINYMPDGTKVSKMYFKGGFAVKGHHDEYEYIPGSHKITGRDFSAMQGRMTHDVELIPEDISGQVFDFMKNFIW